MYVVQLIIFFLPLTIVGEFKILSIKEKRIRYDVIILQTNMHTYIYTLNSI